MAGLVYDKVFYSDNRGKPPSRDELVKTKPRESLVPEAVASSPLASGATLPTPSINPLVKRMASDGPPPTQPPKKAKTSSAVQKKKGSQLLARDSSPEGSQHSSPVEVVVTRPPVVTLDSSTTVSDQDMGRRTETADRRLSLRIKHSFPLPFSASVVEDEILPLREEVAPKVPQEEAGPSTPRLPRYSEEVSQVKREADLALASTADEAESARIHFVNSTLRSFLSSPTYEKRVGNEFPAYFHSIVASTQGIFSVLAALFNEEVTGRPDWYRGLTLVIREGAVLLKEGGETPTPLLEENPL
ncbi:hypothetical protein LIER_40753 [Lithospermum erythrorhizon]|uniref:Uncharacterized protein n=1 Tax=Lithospermum erythrorhizon TaxID=34254 RepID=A0AAV3R0N1_LITER